MNYIWRIYERFWSGRPAKNTESSDSRNVESRPPYLLSFKTSLRKIYSALYRNASAGNAKQICEGPDNASPRQSFTDVARTEERDNAHLKASALEAVTAEGKESSIDSLDSFIYWENLCNEQSLSKQASKDASSLLPSSPKKINETLDKESAVSPKKTADVENRCGNCVNSSWPSTSATSRDLNALFQHAHAANSCFWNDSSIDLLGSCLEGLNISEIATPKNRRTSRYSKATSSPVIDDSGYHNQSQSSSSTSAANCLASSLSTTDGDLRKSRRDENDSSDRSLASTSNSSRASDESKRRENDVARKSRKRRLYGYRDKNALLHEDRSGESHSTDVLAKCLEINRKNSRTLRHNATRRHSRSVEFLNDSLALLDDNYVDDDVYAWNGRNRSLIHVDDNGN